jgi:hypothetical protein
MVGEFKKALKGFDHRLVAIKVQPIVNLKSERVRLGHHPQF